ncbi:hypothetical protein [Agrobacterium tumefaciens]|uniref:hypothetical protein n=1 Tax=Agrobacterium tumefaciens complex TaxID=1183400 RepID=UPI0016595F05|nr:hypothetical protein [Agrobacterium tumefaciens]QNP81832.1 hypothetical protein IAI05_17855 [Agrobacterium tumefaciens]
MMRNLWQLITYHRHRSELWALRFSRSLSAFIRPPPIMLMIMVLYILACLPLVSAYFLLLGLGVSETIAYLIMILPAIAFLFMVAPWFFRWAWIGLSMQFGSFKSADAKEKELSAAIASFKERAAQNA